MSAMESWRVVEASLVREGSIICRKHRNYPFNEFGFAVDFLEEDRLQEQFVGKSGNDGRFGVGNPIRASIEYHPKYNFPLAYWLLVRHPGEFFGQAPALYDGSARSFREQVPADEIIHFNNLRDRAEQDVGMTELDSTIQPLWRIHQYEKALTLSSIASAAKPFWLEQREPTGLLLPSDPSHIEGMGYDNGAIAQQEIPDAQDGVQPQQTGGYPPTNAVVPAARESLPPGYTQKQADPKFPIEAAHDFILDNIRAIAVGAGVSYQHASGDFQNLGFIAGLMCQIPFQDNCRVRQNNLIDGGVDEIFAEWLKSAILIGYFDKSGENVPLSRLDEFLAAAHFKGRGWAFVNPLVQAQALILLNEAGHLTRQQVQNQLPDGMSFEKLVQEFKNEFDEMEENDLPFGKEEATEPGINKQGSDSPGSTKPVPAGTEQGGSADIPPKSKVQSPRSRNRRLRIDNNTVIAMSMNGDGH